MPTDQDIAHVGLDRLADLLRLADLGALAEDPEFMTRALQIIIDAAAVGRGDGEAAGFAAAHRDFERIKRAPDPAAKDWRKVIGRFIDMFRPVDQGDLVYDEEFMEMALRILSDAAAAGQGEGEAAGQRASEHRDFVRIKRET